MKFEIIEEKLERTINYSIHESYGWDVIRIGDYEDLEEFINDINKQWEEIKKKKRRNEEK